MNRIVYTCTGRIAVDRPQLQNVRPSGHWQDEVRVSPEKHAEAMRKLREHYRIKAGMLGMTLEGYCQRFGVKM